MSTTANTPGFVVRSMAQLSRHDIDCILFGGWAEEAAGLRPAGDHADVDLLLPASSFKKLDRFLAANETGIREILQKRFAHKRAFIKDGIMVEIILVQQRSGSPSTWFWGDVLFEWATPLAEPGRLRGHRLAVASRDNLRRYRTEYRRTQPHRWKNAASAAGPT